MSATTTMAVPGIELAHVTSKAHRIPNPSPTHSPQKPHTPHREADDGTRRDHSASSETSNPPPQTIALAAQETNTQAPIPTVRLTMSTEQNNPHATTGGSNHTPDASSENTSLRQAGSEPPSPAVLSSQSTLVPPSISSAHTLQAQHSPSSFEILFPRLSRVIKTDSIHYKRTRHVLGKIFSLTTIVVTLLGVFIYSMRAYVLAKWTSAKDFWEYCNAPNTHDTNCQSLKDKHLALPPYHSDRFFVTGRDYISTTHTSLNSHSTLYILAIVLVPSFLIALSLLLVYYISRRQKSSREGFYHSTPNGYSVRTQIPASWATDPNRNIYLDNSYSTSTATDFSHRSSTTTTSSIRHRPSLEGPQQPVKRLKIASDLEHPSSSQECLHDFRTEYRHPQGFREFCKKCRLEVVDGPTHKEFKEMEERVKGDMGERKNRASIALHKTGDTMMKIINREPLDGSPEQVGRVRVGKDGNAELELSSARLDALGLMR